MNCDKCKKEFDPGNDEVIQVRSGFFESDNSFSPEEDEGYYCLRCWEGR